MWLALAMPFAIAASASAQSATGAIQGSVSDQSGAALPGVTVTVVNTSTSTTRTIVTDAEGLFTAELLPVGPYELTTEIQGFEPKKNAQN
jgi:hypothetical protein